MCGDLCMRTGNNAGRIGCIKIGRYEGRIEVRRRMMRMRDRMSRIYIVNGELLMGWNWDIDKKIKIGIMGKCRGRGWGFEI